jgi:Serine-threonine protein kinase 19
MSFQSTATKSSRIHKPKAGSRRPSPFSTAARRKPRSSSSSTLKKTVSVATDDDIDPEHHVDAEDPRILRARLAPALAADDVPNVLIHVLSRMFAPVPERASGMNSVRIAEVLNYRARLPPIVGVTHVHVLRGSPTATEREIAALVRTGVLRKVSFPGRATGREGVGEGVVLVSEWVRIVEAMDGLSREAKQKYIAQLKSEESEPLTPAELVELYQAGFLTRPSMSPSASDSLLRPGTASLGSLVSVASAGSHFASGTDGAVAASSIPHISGGTGASRHLSQQRGASIQTQHTFSLPNAGPYLKLLTAARTHLLSLLAKSSAFKSMPLDRLKERWDGGVADVETAARHEHKGLLPGRTKKWRQFYGLEFEWVLAECLGAGLVECFKTGSVGTGVRAL